MNGSLHSADINKSLAALRDVVAGWPVVAHLNVVVAELKRLLIVESAAKNYMYGYAVLGDNDPSVATAQGKLFDLLPGGA